MVKGYLSSFPRFLGCTPHGHAVGGVVGVTKPAVKTVVSRRRRQARAGVVRVIGIDGVVALSVVGVAGVVALSVVGVTP